MIFCSLILFWSTFFVAYFKISRWTRVDVGIAYFKISILKKVHLVDIEKTDILWLILYIFILSRKLSNIFPFSQYELDGPILEH